MLKAIEWFCDWVDGVGDRMDRWAGRSPSRQLLVIMIWLLVVLAAILALAAIFTCLYLGRLPYGSG